MANDSGNTEEKEQSQEDTVFALLESATKSTESPSAVLSRAAYQQRLRTFRPATYFAKPANISPLVCARFGWTNPSQDMIVCEKCQAVVAISFHPQLKAADEVRISNIYQEKLCTAHKVTCHFHSNSFPKKSQTVVPSYLGSVLPPETVKLVEQSNPQVLLQQQVKLLIRAVGEERTPLAVELSAKQMSKGETTESFVSRVSESLGCDEDNQWAAVLALFCWEPVDQSVNSDQVAMMQCRTCLAQRGLRVHDSDDTETDSSVDELRPAKKQRTGEQQMNPISSHRHYCPVICGFPSDGSTVPMWQTIATNLFRSEATEKETTEIKGEEIMMKIHRLLQSGLR